MSTNQDIKNTLMKVRHQYVGDVDVALTLQFKKYAENQYWKLDQGKGGFKGHRFQILGSFLVEYMNNSDYYGGYIRWMKWDNTNAPGTISKLCTSKGFITHPRSGAIKGHGFYNTDAVKTPRYNNSHLGKGYTQEVNSAGQITSSKDDGDDGYEFPVIDGDSKQMLFDKSNGFRATTVNEWKFGNVDWRGGGEVLSYKGNPSRYWPVDQFVFIPGLSSSDHSPSIDGDYTYNTVFGSNVYKNGCIYATMPALYHPIDGDGESHQNAQVLGAALNSNKELICIVKTCYNTYPSYKGVGQMLSAWYMHKNGSAFKDFGANEKAARTAVLEEQTNDPKNIYKLVEFKDPGRGYWIEVIKQVDGDIIGGWKRLLRQPITEGMPNCNFFFSEDGTKACSVMYGKLHLITINGDIGTYDTQSLGKFKNTISSVITNDHSESNPGKQASWATGVFGGIYREGVKSGDWIGMRDRTKVYTATKSGKTIIAADYKGNTITTMEVVLSGTEHYSLRRMSGSKWGETALPSRLQWSNGLTGRTLIDPGYHANMNGSDSVITSAVGGNACKPVCTNTVTNMTKISGEGCGEMFRIDRCSPANAGQLAIATITTVTSAANGTTSVTSSVKISGGSFISSTGPATYHPNTGCTVNIIYNVYVGNQQYTIRMMAMCVPSNPTNCCGKAGGTTGGWGKYSAFDYVIPGGYSVEGFIDDVLDWKCP